MRTPAPLKALFKSHRPLQPWPSPKDSIGGPKVFITLRKGYCCWEAVGPASDLFEGELAPAATRYLDSCLVSDTYAVQLSLCMIGKTPESAAPHLFIICKDKATRQNARELLDESLIMQDEKFAGFRLGVSAIAPGESIPRRFTAVRYTDGKPPTGILNTGAITISSSSKRLRPGSSIIVSHHHGSGIKQARATVSLILCSGTRQYFLTAGHPFEPSTTNTLTHNANECLISDPEDLECDFDGLSDTDQSPLNEDEEEMLSIASQSSNDDLDDGSSSLPSIFLKEDRVASTPQSPDESTKSIPELESSSPLRGAQRLEPHDYIPSDRDSDIIDIVRVLNSENGLDYSLVEITGGKEPPTNSMLLRLSGTEAPFCSTISNIRSLARNSLVDVVTATSSSGLQYGKLDSTPTYIRLPGSSRTERVYVGYFKGTFEKGDCGAPVLNNSDHEFCGFIVGGIPGTGAAYVIPGDAIVADAEQRLRRKVTLNTIPFSQMLPSITSGITSTSMHSVLIRRLPESTDQTKLRGILLLSKDFDDCEILSAPIDPEDRGFVAAIATFRTFDGASEARDLINGKRNSSNTSNILVEMIDTTRPPIGRSYFNPGGSFQLPDLSRNPIKSAWPPVHPADQNPPCNTLYIGNLPIDASEDEIKTVFSKQKGYKRLCFRSKQNGPMCFVEFEDVDLATKALNQLYGYTLTNSVRGGIHLSFSKNPLGVRSGQSATLVSNASGSRFGFHANIGGPYSPLSGFGAPPPGLMAPAGFSTTMHMNSLSESSAYPDPGAGISQSSDNIGVMANRQIFFQGTHPTAK